MNTLENTNIAGVTVTINGTAYTYEAHSLDKVAQILGDVAIASGPASIDGITINYFIA
jgi:hypothetical protein